MNTAATGKGLDHILLQEDILKPEQLQEVLEEQRNTGYSLGRLLVDNGLIGEHEKNFLLQKFLGHHLVSLQKTEFDPQLMAVIPRAFALKHRVVAMGQLEDRTLLVAMEDPSDQLLIRLLEDRTGRPIRPFLARRSDLNRAIRRYDALDEAALEFDVEAVGASKPPRPMSQRIANGIVALVILLPLLVFFVGLRYDWMGIATLINREIDEGGLSTFDLAVYMMLAWFIWSLVIYYIGDVLIGSGRRPTQ